MMGDSIKAIERDQARIRRDVFVRQVCYSLLPTIQLRAVGPDGNPDQVRAELTYDSVRVLAPLVEAVEILEAIIWASDGCVGHRDCAHTMEPWQRARALLAGKWQAYEDRKAWP